MSWLGSRQDPRGVDCRVRPMAESNNKNEEVLKDVSKMNQTTEPGIFTPTDGVSGTRKAHGHVDMHSIAKRKQRIRHDQMTKVKMKINNWTKWIPIRKKSYLAKRITKMKYGRAHLGLGVAEGGVVCPHR